MNICMVSRDFYPDIGGIASHVLELSKELAGHGHNVHVVRVSYGKGTDEIKKMHGFTAHYVHIPGSIPKLRFLISGIRAAAYINKLIRTEKIEVLHWHDYVSSSIETKISGRGISKVFTNHSSNYLEDVGRKRFHIIRYMLSHADAVIAPSRELWEKSFAIAGQEKAFYIPNGVDAQKFRPVKSNVALKKKLGIASNEKVVLCPRRLEPKNGVIYFAKAVPGIARKVKKCRFVIVGGGFPEEREKIEKELKENGSSKKVVLAGAVENSEMPAYYSIADVVVLPSIMEATSIAGLEAMACGKPLVGSNIGGIPEIIENNRTGILVEPAQHRQIELKVNELLLDKAAMERLGRNARKKIEKKFTWEIIAGKTIEVYRRCML